MAWNQPGNNGQDRDPWGSSKPGGNSEGNGNKGGRDQGPPDLDDIFRKLSKKLGGLGGGKGTGSGGGSSSQGPRPQLGGRVVTIAAAAIVIIWAASGFYTIKEAERGVVTTRPPSCGRGPCDELPPPDPVPLPPPRPPSFLLSLRKISSKSGGP